MYKGCVGEVVLVLVFVDECVIGKKWFEFAVEEGVNLAA